MEVAKKSVFLLGMAILSSSAIAMEITRNELMAEINTGYEAFFYELNPALNLFNRTLDMTILSEEIRLWRQALSNLQNYVDNNAKGNKKLSNAVNLAKEVGNGLVDTILTGYKTVVSGEFTNYQELEIDIEYLLSSKKELDNAIKTLGGDPWWIGKKREVRSVLLEVLSLLEKIIKRTVEDFIKVTKSVGWVSTPALVGQIEDVYPAMGEQYF